MTTSFLMGNLSGSDTSLNAEILTNSESRVVMAMEPIFNIHPCQIRFGFHQEESNAVLTIYGPYGMVLLQAHGRDRFKASVELQKAAASRIVSQINRLISVHNELSVIDATRSLFVGYRDNVDTEQGVQGVPWPQERIIEKISTAYSLHPTQVSVSIIGEIFTPENGFEEQAWVATARVNSGNLRQFAGHGNSSSRALADLLCCVQKELEESARKHNQKADALQKAINL